MKTFMFAAAAALLASIVLSAQDREALAKADSQRNLKQVAVALLLYASDYDDRLPHQRDRERVDRALQPYLKSKAVFVQPHFKKPYAWNATLAGKDIAKIKASMDWITFYETAPWGDGSRNAAFLDGRAKSIAQSDWPKVSAKSGLK